MKKTVAVILLTLMFYIQAIRSMPTDLTDTQQNVQDLPEFELKPIPINDAEDIEALSAYVTQLLQDISWGEKETPVLYVEDIPSGFDENPELENENVPEKRSRYYRRYPWKRQNGRSRYVVDDRYMCSPTKEEVFKLLVALHDARSGNKGKTVTFCNRKRPAHAIVTNIRFLGRKK